MPTKTRKGTADVMVSRPTKLKLENFTKRAFSEDAFTATKTAIEQVYDKMDLHLHAIREQMRQPPPKRVTTKKDEVREYSLGYQLGSLTGNIRAARHPISGYCLAVQGVSGFFQGLKEGWNDRREVYKAVVKQLNDIKALEQQQDKAVLA